MNVLVLSKKSNNNNNHNNTDNNSRKASIMPFKVKAYHHCCGFFILMQISRVIQAYFFLIHALLCFQVLALSLLFSDNIVRHYISHEFRNSRVQSVNLPIKILGITWRCVALRVQIWLRNYLRAVLETSESHPCCRSLSKNNCIRKNVKVGRF